MIVYKDKLTKDEESKNTKRLMNVFEVISEKFLLDLELV